jgi:hypothetical protein
MLDILLELRPRFTDADKEACIPVINRMTELAHSAREKGVASLEKETEHEESFFLRKAAGMVADAICSKFGAQCLQQMILAGEYSGAELLSRLIIAEGMLAIQKETHPAILKKKLTAMLDEKYLMRLDEDDVAEFEAETCNAEEEYLKLVAEEPEPMKWINAFELILLQLSDCAVGRLMKDVYEGDVAVALTTCNQKVLHKALKNMTVDFGAKVVREKKYLYSVCVRDVTEAQDRIVSVICALVRDGDIQF